MSIKFQPLHSLATIEQEVRAAEKVIDTHVISLPLRDKLFHKLDKSLKQVVAAQKTSEGLQGVQVRLNEFRERITWLFGEVQNRAMENEVNEIAKEAQDLDVTMQKGDLTRVAEAVSHLDEHIQAFSRDNAPGRQERRTIAAARATQKRALSYLEGHGLDKARPYLMNQLNLLEVQQPLRDDEIDEELIVEIFEAAECFYQAKTKEGLQRFHQLSTRAKLRFRAHLAELGILHADPLADRTKTAQALIAAAYDLTDSHDGEPYLTEKQLENLFEKIL